MVNSVDQADPTAGRVRELVEEVIDASPIFLVDVEVRGSRGSRVVEIFVDSDEELNVDTLARISREVEVLLDVEDVISGRYSLNVSTPGLDRPLAMPRQYRKNVGRPLRVHYRKEDGRGNTEAEGTLVGADDEAIDVEVSDADIRRIRFDEIMWAKVQLPW